MALTLLTLNIEADRHLERVHAAIATHSPHIVCLQEVLETSCKSFEAMAGYRVTYAATARMPAQPGSEATPPCHWGIAVLTRIPVMRQTAIYYTDDSRIRLFERPNDPRRVLLVTELEYEGQRHRIVTTHFTWSPNGEATDEQRADFARLQDRLAPYPDYVLCGDFNAPRGREMFERFRDELGLNDHLPADVATTLDPRYHYAGALQLVVDTVFATPHYRTHGLRVLEGISDHKGILVTLERR